MKWMDMHFYKLFLVAIFIPVLAFADLKSDKNHLKQELESVQKQSVTLTKEIRNKQNEISNLSNELEQLSFQAEQKSKSAKEISEKLNQATDAMIEITRIPKEMALLNPDAKNLTTIEILTSITEQCEALVVEFEKEIADIKSIKSKIARQKGKINQELANLQKKQRTLNAGLVKRQKLYKQVNKDYKKWAVEADEIGKKSKDANELFSKLASITPTKKPRHHSATRKVRKFAKGRLTMPIKGDITKRYTSKHKGIKIRPRKNTTVTAPFDGKVLFAGKFRDYGQMVIIKHDKNYHSVLAGLSDISVAIGQRIFSGEPIGEIRRKELYFELRKKSKPINPNGWFEG